MRKLSDSSADAKYLRDQIIGLGKNSLKKSYYKEFQQTIEELVKFRSLLDKSNDSIFLLKIPSTEIFYLNDSACTLLGKTKDLILSTNLVSYMDTSGANAILKIIKSFIEEEKEFNKNVNVKIKDTEKHFRSIEINFHIEQYDNEKVAVAVARDITERLKIQDALLKAKEAAEKADKLKSEFLAQMSHEIRTPTNTILSFSSLLKEELIGTIHGDLKSGFQMIDRAGKRLVRTIDLILNMSEIQTGTYDYRPKKFDVYNDCLVPIYLAYKFIAQDKNIDLILSKNADSSEVIADEYTINQIFYNLIDNAVKYTKSGSVTILVERKKTTLSIAIKDTGIGIAKEYIPLLFTPFSQEEQGYTRRFDGNGLGLALVKKFCELNKATIQVESEKNSGSTFTVIF
jgi:PAS domain S-box-containing protein